MGLNDLRWIIQVVVRFTDQRGDATGAGACALARETMIMKPLILTAIVLMGMAGALRAEEEDCYVRMSDWQPRSAILQVAAANGWEVFRIKTDDGCYQIWAIDAEGRPIEVTLNPATLEVLTLEYEALHDNDDSPERETAGHGEGDDD
jgi:hypothetical protein